MPRLLEAAAGMPRLVGAAAGMLSFLEEVAEIHWVVEGSQVAEAVKHLLSQTKKSLK